MVPLMVPLTIGHDVRRRSLHSLSFSIVHRSRATDSFHGSFNGSTYINPVYLVDYGSKLLEDIWRKMNFYFRSPAFPRVGGAGGQLFRVGCGGRFFRSISFQLIDVVESVVRLRSEKAFFLVAFSMSILSLFVHLLFRSQNQNHVESLSDSCYYCLLA